MPGVGAAYHLHVSGDSPVATERFVGRSAELRQVAAAGAAAKEGQGSLLVVLGEAGIGKSRFCDEVRVQLSRMGLSVVAARCWVDGGAPAYWPWQAILGELCGEEVRDLGERHGGPVGAEADRFSRFASVTERLGAACQRRPACIIIDDVHAADPDALLLLRYVARSAAGLPLLLLLARRTESRNVELASGGATDLLDHIEQEATPVLLRHFDFEETTAFLASYGLGHLDAPLALALLKVTRGNPLFLRRMAARGAAEPPAASPAGLLAAIEEAWQRLSAGARRVLQPAAVLGLNPRVTEAAAVADTGSAEIFDAITEATRAGLVSGEGTDRFCFSHELVRAAAEHAMRAAERLDAHARAAALFESPSSAGVADRLARHAHHALAAAPRSVPDGVRAVAASRAAARSMVRGFGYEQAAGLLQAAVGLHDSHGLGAPPAALLVEWAQAVLCCGRLAEARRIFERAALFAEHEGDPRLFAEAALGLGGVWVNESRAPVERARVLGIQRAALAALPPGEPTLACRLRTRLAAEDVYQGGPVAAVIDALSECRAADDAQTLAEGLSLCHHVMLTPEHARDRLLLADELIAVASQTGLGVLGLMGLCWRTADLFQLGDPRAVQALQALRERADVLACQSILYIVEVFDVMLTIRAGRLDEAADRARKAYESGQAVGDIDAFAYLAGQTAALCWLRGQDDELFELTWGTASSPTLASTEFAFQATAASVAARTGRSDRARAVLDKLSVDGLAALPRSSTWLTAMTAIVEVTLALGDESLAHEAYELLAPFADLPVMPSVGIVCLGSTERPLGLAAMTFGDDDLAVAHLERALSADVSLGTRPVAAVARAELAEALWRRARPGDRLRASTVLDLAIREGDAMGMTGRTEQWRARRHQMDTTNEAGEISRQGRAWLVMLGDRRVPVGDLIGMQYLAELVSQPGREIPALDLAGGANLPVDLPPHEVLDPAARAAYAARGRQLTQELADAEATDDARRAERIRSEMDDLADQLDGATGLGGRSRAFTGPAERARTAVRKAIKRAIDEIEQAEPSVGAVLRDNVHTGTTCCYEPDPEAPVSWVVREGPPG